MQKLSKGLYLGWIIGGEVAGIFLIIVAVVLAVAAGVVTGISEGKMNPASIGILGTGIFIMLVGMASTIVAAVFGYILLYKAWQAIQDGQPRTTPGKAVGFLFIPFFNFYWMFMAYWGYAKDFNTYIASKGLSLAQLPEKLYLAFPIVVLCSGIPYAVSIAGLAVIVIYIIISNQMIDGVNGIYNAKAMPADVTPAEQSPTSSV